MSANSNTTDRPYSIDPGCGPSLDRLADSWRYYVTPTDVLVSFSVSYLDLALEVQKFHVDAEVYVLRHMSDDIVEAEMIIRTCDDPSWLTQKVLLRYNHLRRSGHIDKVA